MQEQLQLRYTDSRSDKVYNVALLPKEEGYIVNFSYGRFGKPLKAGTKTAKPVPYEQAKRAFDKIVTEKMGKGYVPKGAPNTSVPSQTAVERVSQLPQLLTPIEEENLSEVLSGAARYTLAQTKHDGERRLVFMTESELYGGNRRGLKVDLPETAKEELRNALQGEYIFDAEDMGTHLVIFDVLNWQGKDLRDMEFEDRVSYLEELEDLLNTCFHIWVDVPIDLAHMDELQALVRILEHLGEEGVVFRDPFSKYEPGRPNSGGPARKLKFYATATCQVADIHPTKRSVSLRLYDNGDAVDVGNCTIPPNYSIPSIGALVEIKYLYAYRGGSIYQPQYKGERTDLLPEAADYQQLKFKE